MLDEKFIVGELLRFARGQDPAYAARCQDLWQGMPGAYRKAAIALVDLPRAPDLSLVDQIERVYGEPD